MVHPDEGRVQSRGERLGEVQPHQQGPGQPRSVGGGHAAQVAVGYPGGLQGLADHGEDSGRVVPAGQLGNDAAVISEEVGLG